MSAKARGLLAAAIAVLLLAGVTVLFRAPATVAGGPATAPSPPAAGRPVPLDSGSTAAGPSAGEAQEPGVRELLERRAAAIRQRDEAGFTATLDPQADPGFLAAQRALFDNLADVPLAEWTYHVDGATSLPVAGNDGYAPRTTLRYALRGVDLVPTERPLGYRYVQRGGEWRLNADFALGPAAEPTWRGPWDFGPCRTLTAPAGLVISHPGGAELAAALAAELEDAVNEVIQVWGSDWPQRAALLLPASEEEFRALVGPSLATTGIAAAAVADRVDVASRTATGQRIVFNPAETGKLSATARRIVLRHELTHLATRASTVDGAPMWLLEGFADYVGYRNGGLAPREAAPDLTSAVSQGKLPAGPPADADFHGATGRLDLTYQLAWSLALHVAERDGEAHLVRFYRQVAGTPGLGPSTVDAVVAGALRDVLGTDLTGLIDSWRRWLPSEFG